MNCVFTDTEIMKEISETKEEIRRCIDDKGEVNSSISKLEEKDHLSERYGLYTYSIGNVMGLVCAKRIGGPYTSCYTASYVYKLQGTKQA